LPDFAVPFGSLAKRFSAKSSFSLTDKASLPIPLIDPPPKIWLKLMVPNPDDSDKKS
jgi:hypothetical protein